MAIYEAAEQWRVIILFVPVAVGQIVLPILSSIVNDDNRKYWKVLKINILINLVVSLVIVLLVALFSRYIMSAYGEGFDDTTTLIVLSSSAIFSAVSNVVGSAIASRAKMWVGFIFNMIWAILVIAFTKIFLGMGYGALAIALSFLCSYILHTIISYVYLKVTLKNG